MNSRNSFYLLALIPVLLAFLVWNFDFESSLDAISNTELDSLDISQNTETPDAILINPRVSQFDLDGQLQQTLQGTELYSYDQGSRIQLELPEFLLSDTSGEHWDISALRGYLRQGQSIFQLEDQVEMHKQSDTLPINFSTNSLEIDLNRQIIQTNAEILIQAPGNRLSGTGFEANLQTNEFKILDGVNATHETP